MKTKMLGIGNKSNFRRSELSISKVEMYTNTIKVQSKGNLQWAVIISGTREKT